MLNLFELLLLINATVQYVLLTDAKPEPPAESPTTDGTLPGGYRLY